MEVIDGAAQPATPPVGCSSRSVAITASGTRPCETPLIKNINCSGAGPVATTHAAAAAVDRAVAAAAAATAPAAAAAAEAAPTVASSSKTAASDSDSVTDDSAPSPSLAQRLPHKLCSAREYDCAGRRPPAADSGAGAAAAAAVRPSQTPTTSPAPYSHA